MDIIHRTFNYFLNNKDIDIKKIYWYVFLLSLSMPSLTFSQGNSQKYSPRIQTEGKIGNRRSIVRPAALIPLYQRSESLIHLSLIGMSDTQSALEGNVGVGVRHLIKRNIFGLYGFYDIRKSSKSNMIHQITMGAEWFKKYFEFRFNVYLPRKKTFSTSEVKNVSNYRKSGSTVNIALFSSKQVEQALPGFDIDIGTQLPGLPDLTLRGAYYRFSSSDKHIETRNGFRGVLGYKLYEFLQLDWEISYDNQRELVYFGGLTLGYNFDKGNKHSTGLTRLEKKMTILPIRDIDAVVGQGRKQELLDGVEISGIDENTTILIANSTKSELTMLDIVDGELVIRVSKYNAENDHISKIISLYRDKDIITDKRILTFMVKGDHGSYEIVDVNEVVYDTAGVDVHLSRDYKASTKDREEFINVVNFVSASSDNIVWWKFDEDAKQALTIKLKKLRDEADRKQRELEDELQHLKDEATQKQHELEEDALHKQAELENEIHRLATESLEQQRELTNQLQLLQQSTEQQRIELTENALQRESELEDELQLLQNESSQKQKELSEQLLREQQQALFHHNQLTEKLRITQDEALQHSSKLEKQLQLEQKQALERQKKLEEQLRNDQKRFLERKNELEEQLRVGQKDAKQRQLQFQESLLSEQNQSTQIQHELEEKFRIAQQNALQKQKELEEQLLLEQDSASQKYEKLKQELLSGQTLLSQTQLKLKKQLRVAQEDALRQQTELKVQLQKMQEMGLQTQNALKKQLLLGQEESLLQQNELKEQLRLEQQSTLLQQKELTSLSKELKMTKLNTQRQQQQVSEYMNRFRQNEMSFKRTIQKQLEELQITQKQTVSEKQRRLSLQTKLKKRNLEMSHMQKELERLQKLNDNLSRGRLSRALKQIQEHSNTQKISRERVSKQHSHKLQSKISQLQSDQLRMKSLLYQQSITSSEMENDSSDDELLHKSKKRHKVKKKLKQRTLPTHTKHPSYQSSMQLQHSFKIGIPNLSTTLSVIDSPKHKHKSKKRFEPQVFTFDIDETQGINSHQKQKRVLTPISKLKPLTPSQRIDFNLKLSHMQLNESVTLEETKLLDMGLQLSDDER